MSKAAIVIGVNKTGGNLPVLRACVSGAREFGKWLKGEGFDVYYFLDENQPVTAGDIGQRIKSLVDQGTLQQLVIYFSGHGFLNNYSYWMLSEAPVDANEAVCVNESVQLARQCGIPSVVMISDACRSTPQAFQAGHVRGSLIFPNEPVSANSSPEIDRYFATLVGNPAFEIPVGRSAKRHKGIFTECSLKAYKQPNPDMVSELTSDGRTVKVVLNRPLKEYLRQEVPKLMLRKKLVVGQMPDAIVESDKVYLGCVVEAKPKIEVTPRRILDVRDTAQVALARGFHSSPDLPQSIIDAIDAEAHPDFDTSRDLIGAAQTRGALHFETMCGFKVFGAQVSEALGLNMDAEILYAGDSTEPAYVRLNPGSAGMREARNVSSVMLRFSDGSGTVLAGLPQHVATIVVDKGRVVNVSYAPSDNSDLWFGYNSERVRVEQLRALVSTAARFGVFRVDRENAGVIANEIRYAKSIDPTLGLYAAYAYSEVGMSHEVRSVMEYMTGDLSALLFDVAMLAGELSKAPTDTRTLVVPFCPMLSQGWTLVRAMGVLISPDLEEAAASLLPSLWTTFDSKGMDLIYRAIRDGRL